jgi:hypothetical protein
MKTNYLQKSILTFLLLVAGSLIYAQRASVSKLIQVSRTTCNGSSLFSYFDYNELINRATASVSPADCNVPRLRIGPSSTTNRFTASLSSVSYNPADSNVYFLWTTFSPSTRTYIWRWPVGYCNSNTSLPWLDTIRSFPVDILGVAFTPDGIGYMLEYGATAPYTMFLRSINFATNTIGSADTLILSNNKKIYQSSNGDIAISPSGQMYFVVDNKLFTPKYSEYGNPTNRITTTFIDTIAASSSQSSLQSLAYAQGELVAGYKHDPSGSTSDSCYIREIDPLLGNTYIVTNTTTKSFIDGASLIMSIGAAERLVGLTNVSGSTYDVSYDVIIKNLGNTRLRNIQITNNLAAVNPLGTVSNVSTSFITNPNNAFVLNSGFNGAGNNNLLTLNGNALKNFPTTEDSIVIRVNYRITNIVQGVIYNNHSVVTATSFLGTQVRDTSTNGINPDKNYNDVADEFGESDPTPFIVNYPTLPGACTQFLNTLYTQSFGTGTGLSSVLPVASGYTYPPTSSMTATNVQPVNIESYSITNNANNGDNTFWQNLTDHTGNTNGRMLVVNADLQSAVMYRDTISLCGGHQYSLVFYAASLPNATYNNFCDAFIGTRIPKFIGRIKSLSGLILAETGAVEITSSGWQQYGFRWVMPPAISRVIFEVVNAGDGGCGNDVAFDDISIGTCDPQITVTQSVTSGCIGATATFTATVNNSDVIPGAKIYRLEQSPDQVAWTTIATQTSNVFSFTVTAASTNKYYRVLLAADNGININTTSCRFTSANYFMPLKSESIIADSVKRNKNNICPGESVVLTKFGGTLGSGASWVWREGSCTGTIVGTGNSITVSPTVNTTYYVGAEGDCNKTLCLPITVVINCDIDDDDDGIPDLVETGGVDVELDHDFDGIPNYKDAQSPGFTDANSDGTDDRYDTDLDGIVDQLDRDSDNDGIPDVVESSGVDADGDGRIDNFVDVDSDGFSQNVDGNTTGHLISGSGLGQLDLDADGIPNYKDLDSDNDGIPDLLEVQATDTNNDGKVDIFSDADNDGYTNVYDTDKNNDLVIESLANGLLKTSADANSDGRADTYPNKNQDGDGRANPYDLDSDGDAISDVKEVLLGQTKQYGSTVISDANNDGFADGAINTKGWNIDVAALANFNMPNNDSDTRPDYLDIDSDNDGITDNIEAMSTFLPGANYTMPDGVDTDNDGIQDIYELHVGTFQGGRLNPIDMDSDGTPDYLDLDTDGDGQSDAIEGNDNNNNQIADDNITLTNLDSDSDGLDDRFDINTNYILTSSNLGNNGVFTGPVINGTASQITRSWAFQNDRDWRWSGMILNTELISFTGKLNNSSALLHWTYVASELISSVQIERSYDGVNFSLIGQAAGSNAIQVSVSGTYQDNMLLTSGKVYYRITLVGNAGGYKRSHAIILKTQSKQSIIASVYPNPTSDYATVQIQTPQSTAAVVSLINKMGQRVQTVRTALFTGTNNLQFTNLSKYATGEYTIEVIVENRRYAKPLFIQH